MHAKSGGGVARGALAASLLTRALKTPLRRPGRWAEAVSESGRSGVVVLCGLALLLLSVQHMLRDTAEKLVRARGTALFFCLSIS